MLDYRIYKKNVAQQFAINCIANQSQQFQCNSISGDAVALLFYITPSSRDISPCVYDTFYPISSIQLVDQQNQSLTNNVVPVSTPELIDYAIMNSGHDFFSYKNIYMIPFSTTVIDCILNNKINGCVHMPSPVFKINVTPTNTNANCTLNVLAYITAFLRISGGVASEFSSG